MTNATSKEKQKKKKNPSSPPPNDEDNNNTNDDDNSSVSVVDSADDYSSDYDSDAASESSNDTASGSDDDDEDDDGFEDQGSSSEDDDDDADIPSDDESSGDELQVIDVSYDEAPRQWATKSQPKRKTTSTTTNTTPTTQPPSSSSSSTAITPALWMHTDDLSSDDEDPTATSNRIGRVPLHWYDEYDHLGYDAHGKKVLKPPPTDKLDDALSETNKKNTIYDALNGVNVTLTPRQLTLLRRIQAGAFAHPEHEAHPDYIDYYSGVDKEVSGIRSAAPPPKSRFQPSRWEKLQVRRLLHRLKMGSINMDYLEGKVRDMNDVIGKKGNKKKEAKKEEESGNYLLWKGDEEDELNLRKGPQHIAAPKLAPPGHAESYNPSEEPSPEELKEWESMDVVDRPHGLLVPKKFKNLRSVGAYEFSVRERFERCLDLYLCPRVMKRRLNIDPESLVPSLPKASDLRPFPNAKCIEYETPYDKSDADATPPIIRCLSPSPDGHYLASGASDGFVRMWEVSTGRLLRSWDVSNIVTEFQSKASDDDGKKEESQVNNNDNKPKPVVALEWNPNPSHHVLLAAVGTCCIIISTGTSHSSDAEVTDALLSATLKPPSTNKLSSLISWNPLPPSSTPPISAHAKSTPTGPIALLHTTHSLTHVQFHRKGDYFVTIAPKTPSGGAILIHQLSKATSQKPFSKTKHEPQKAMFHPRQPFLFIANQRDIRVYHLLQQKLVKTLSSGCRHIISLDVHPTGDHVICGSLDRRAVWFDLDLGSRPYKTLKYHERALRCVSYHKRYPLMASSSDDGSVHVFHGMVYDDLMRNPLIVPVKVLRGRGGHEVVNDWGVLSCVFHPMQPWLFSGGADGKIILWQDV